MFARCSSKSQTVVLFAAFLTSQDQNGNFAVQTGAGGGFVRLVSGNVAGGEAQVKVSCEDARQSLLSQVDPKTDVCAMSLLREGTK